MLLVHLGSSSPGQLLGFSPQKRIVSLGQIWYGGQCCAKSGSSRPVSSLPRTTPCPMLSFASLFAMSWSGCLSGSLRLRSRRTQPKKCIFITMDEVGSKKARLHHRLGSPRYKARAAKVQISHDQQDLDERDGQRRDAGQRGGERRRGEAMKLI